MQRIKDSHLDNTTSRPRIGRSVQVYRISPRNRRRAFLLPFSFLMLSMAVFGWGLQYKLSLYQSKDSVSHLAPEAKLLSQKERPTTGQALSARPTELPPLPFSPALLGVTLASAPGLFQSDARYVRTGSLEGSRAPMPPCVKGLFFRPPPVLS
jgi:hypothetical protein